LLCLTSALTLGIEVDALLLVLQHDDASEQV
jgi:hypothetical protein